MRSTIYLCLFGLLFASFTYSWTIPTQIIGSKFQRTKTTELRYVNDKSVEHAATRIGEVLLDGKYILTGYIPVPSLKCDIYKAYPLNAHGQIQGDQPLIVKFSDSNVDVEYINYQRLWARLTPEQENLFVKIHDRIPGTVVPVNEWGQAVETTESHHPPGIVMERGYDNLRVFLRKHGAYKGDGLRQAFYSVISTVHALHSNNLIWTELKPENFVVTPTGIKGIDLESIVPTNELLQVYTAEACPPEFPLDEMYISLPEMAVTEAFDVWGLGLVLFEIATGHSFYAGGMTDLEYIKRQLRYPDRTLLQARAKLRRNVDPQAAAIIMACLQADPRKRPSCQQILASDYFIAARMGSSTTDHPLSNDADLSSTSTSGYYQSRTTTSTADKTFARNASKRASSSLDIGLGLFATPRRGSSSSSQKKQQEPFAEHSSTIAAKEQLVQKVHSKARTAASSSGRARSTSGNKSIASQTITVEAEVRSYVPGPPRRSITLNGSRAQPSTGKQLQPPNTTVKLAPSPMRKQSALDHVFKAAEPIDRTDVGSVASSPKISREEQQLRDWKKQLTQVLDTLALHAKEDPEMAYDLVSILDRAKEKVLPTPTPTLGY